MAKAPSPKCSAQSSWTVTDGQKICRYSHHNPKEAIHSLHHCQYSTMNVDDMTPLNNNLLGLMKKVFINCHLFILIPYPVCSNSQIGINWKILWQIARYKNFTTILPDLCRTYDISVGE